MTNIYRTDHISAIDSMRTTFRWKPPLDLEARGLSLHSLLVNPALWTMYFLFARVMLMTLRMLKEWEKHTELEDVRSSKQWLFITYHCTCEDRRTILIVFSRHWYGTDGHVFYFVLKRSIARVIIVSIFISQLSGLADRGIVRKIERSPEGIFLPWLLNDAVLDSSGFLSSHCCGSVATRKSRTVFLCLLLPVRLLRLLGCWLPFVHLVILSTFYKKVVSQPGWLSCSTLKLERLSKEAKK